MIDDPGYDGNHVNGFIELIDKGKVIPIMGLTGLMDRHLHRWTKKDRVKSRKNRER